MAFISGCTSCILRIATTLLCRSGKIKMLMTTVRRMIAQPQFPTNPYIHFSDRWSGTTRNESHPKSIARTKNGSASWRMSKSFRTKEERQIRGAVCERQVERDEIPWVAIGHDRWQRHDAVHDRRLLHPGDGRRRGSSGCPLPETSSVPSYAGWLTTSDAESRSIPSSCMTPPGQHAPVEKTSRWLTEGEG